MNNQSDKAKHLRALHHRDTPLLLCNAWDAASARILLTLGYPAVATTSAGIAYVEGYPDGQRIDREAMLRGVARVARAVNVPVTADLEGAYGNTVADAVATANGAIDAGAVGLNIEDGIGDGGDELLDVDLQAQRIREIRAVGRERGVELVINARTDVFWRSSTDDRSRLSTTVARAHAYVDAGADSIFVPGLIDPDLIGELVAAVAAPINILAGPASPTVTELRALGVRRISCGSAPFGYAMGMFRRAALEVRDHGTFTFAAERISHADLNALFERRP